MNKKDIYAEKKLGICEDEIINLLPKHPTIRKLEIYYSKITPDTSNINTDFSDIEVKLKTFTANWFEEETHIRTWKPRQLLFASEDNPVLKTGIDYKIEYKTKDGVLLCRYIDEAIPNDAICYFTERINRNDIDESLCFVRNTLIDWYIVLQWQLGVTNTNDGFIAWITMPRDFNYRTFMDAEGPPEILRSALTLHKIYCRANDGLIKHLQKTASDFWQNHVEKHSPPTTRDLC